jgi:phospholipid/cholesterol/gamma-HCH transport system permease protein
MARAKFGVDIGIFLNTAEESLKMKDIYGGLFKSMVFGMTIAAVSCSQGLRAGQGPAGVGRATLRAVVISFIFILAFDYLISPMIW